MERDIPNEIRDYKEGIAAGLTLKQILSIALALGLALGFYYLGGRVSYILALLGFMLGAAVPILFGFFKFNGLTTLQFLRVVWKGYVISPTLRLWKSEIIDYAYLADSKEQEDSSDHAVKSSDGSATNPDKKPTPKKKKKKEKESAKVPRTLQESIPIETVYADGIFSAAPGEFSCIWKVRDVSYVTEDDPQKEKILISYAHLLTKIDDTMSIQLTVTNRYVNPDEYRETVLLKPNQDGLDHYRDEMNRIVETEAALAHSLVRERYICLTTSRRLLDEARKAFAHVNMELAKAFDRLGTTGTICSLSDTMRIYHQFFRSGEEKYFRFDFEQAIRQGMSFKDFITPDYLSFKKDYFEMGERFGRVLFLNEFPNVLQDTLINDLMDREQNIVLSIHMKKLTKGESKKFIQTKMDAVEADIERWSKNSNRRGNFVSDIPYRKRTVKKSVESYMDEVVKYGQRIIFTTVAVAVTADTLDELNSSTQDIIATAASHSCDMRKLIYQQEAGLRTSLPFGINGISVQRTLITEAAALLHLFRMKEMKHPGGVWKGHHPGTKNQIFVDRTLPELANGNGLILGKTGSGKSFFVKLELLLMILSTDKDILILDIDREYGDLVRALGGEVVSFSPSSVARINAMELVEDGTVEEQIKRKSDYLQSLVVQARNEDITGSERSIIDRCVKKIFETFFSQKEQGENPSLVILQNFHESLLQQPEPEAKALALEMEIFVTGSLDIFSSETTVDVRNRIVCFDIHDIPNALMGVAALAFLDFMDNRVALNRKNGKLTYVLIDEIQEIAKHRQGADYLLFSWRHIRKMGGLATGATQNAFSILNSEVGKTMLANSEYKILLGQDEQDLAILKGLMGLSEEEVEYLDSGSPGCGLIKIGTDTVTFENDFPKDSFIFKLLDTRPTAAHRAEGED